jgi:hypothetical protein
VNAEAWRSTAPGVDRTRAELVATLEQRAPPVTLLAPHSDEPELDLDGFPLMRAFLQRCYHRHSINRTFDATWTVLERTAACQPDAANG